MRSATPKVLHEVGGRTLLGHVMAAVAELDPEHTIADAELELERRGLIKKGDQLIILSDVMAGSERFDSIQIRQVI